MILKYKILILLLILLEINIFSQINSDHPNLFLTPQSVKYIRENLGKYPIFDNSLEKMKCEIDTLITKEIDVPVPKDPAGGYTHYRHKRNYKIMFQAGIMWQITGKKEYANFVKKILLKYAYLYPHLDLHPVKKSYARGKLFWQLLNESVWLVYTSIAYDCIYNYLTGEERTEIEKQLLIPYAKFLSYENSKVFNRIHNHGVWAVAAVGMSGFVTQNKQLINAALYGIMSQKGKAGFFTQMDSLFSPQGYYTEGPYYQRYAMTPFLFFAQAIDHILPKLNIFAYRDSILLKAVETTLQLTNLKGQFFPFNDAVKEMSYLAQPLILAVDIAYDRNQSKKSLLSIAKLQNKVIISGAGLNVAKDIYFHEAKPFKKVSLQINDGAHGQKGAIGILRASSNGNNITLLMKYASQGLGHGHFDRLALMMYNNGNEVFLDYGAVRYVNILYKEGGRYLKENKTWAKQTIAHNTITLDSVSDFKGNYKIANKFSAEAYFFDSSNDNIQLMSAKDTNAYSGTILHRTIVSINDSKIFQNPVIIDIYRLKSTKKHTIDLAWYYKGQFMKTNIHYVPYTRSKSVLGTKNGYQHLWVNAKGRVNDSIFHFIFMNQHKFYSLTSNSNDEVYFVQIGANDPHFNLRNENGLILRERNKDNYTFVNVIEVFGTHNPISEVTKNLNNSIIKTELIYNDKAYTVVKITKQDHTNLNLALSNNNNDKNALHKINIAGKTIRWHGVYYIFTNL
ncbi:MAG: heparinase II/III family protein [Bacteroidales bacterium]|nr:heparinase II/III family protein [Bacteroidales bacterium]